MSLLTQYTPHSSLFASPLGVLITQGCLARQSYVNDRQPLVRAAQDLFKQHAQADIIVGLLPFNTTRAAQPFVISQTLNLTKSLHNNYLSLKKISKNMPSLLKILSKRWRLFVTRLRQQKLRTLLNALHVSPELIQQGITQ